MGTSRFILRADKPLKNGTSPVDLLYSISGQRKYYRTELKFYPECWDVARQEPLYLDRKTAKKVLPAIDFDLLPTAEDIKENKQEMKEIINSIKNIEKMYRLNKVQYSSEMVLERLKSEKHSITKKEADTNVVFEFMQKYIDDHKNLREVGSLSVYKSVKNHLEGFCKATGNKVTFQNINYPFFQSFQAYLLQDKTDAKGQNIPGLNNTTIAKQLSTIKTFLNYAKKQGIEVTDKYKDFKIKRESLEVIALTNDEFLKLFNLDLTDNKRFAETRDVFCFACTTGLRYSDLEQLKREHIKQQEIHLTVKKTKELLTVPLNSYSKAILNKYAEMLRPLPVISNQNLNYNVKDLCKLAEINEQIEIVRFRGIKRETKTYPKFKLIGVHTGRKTFATLSLERGMSTEEVMSITGHKDYKSFKRYVKVTEQRKKVVMLKAWEGATEQNQLKAV